jgi:hypothetical protein
LKFSPVYKEKLIDKISEEDMYYSKISRPIRLGMRTLLLLAIVFLNFGPSGSGTVLAAPPQNNDFANATNIPGIPFNPTPYLVDEADVQAQEPQVNVLCDNKLLYIGNNTVWYQYTPGANGSVSMNTAGSSYDTYMAIWTGNALNNLSLVACDDDDAEGLTSRISFPVTAGVTYYIQIAKYNGTQAAPGDPTSCPCTLDFNVALFDAEVYIGDTLKKTYAINNYELDSYKGVQGGPLFVKNPNSNPLVSSLRLLYRNPKADTYSELMGVPDSQLAGDYWLPYFIDNATHDSQIRFTNTHESLSTTINIYLGNTLVHSQVLGPKEADRAPMTGLVGGPVRIESTTGGVNILAGMRIIYKNKSSFDEIMALPTALLDDKYWFPFYNHNNVNLFTEVRVGVPAVP